MVRANPTLRENHFFLLAIFLFLFSFQLNAQIPLEIWEVQGNGNSSPFDDDFVVLTNNVVTAITNNRFYIQSTSNNSDNDPSTSDGIVVYAGNTPQVQIGDIVSVEGFVNEFDDVTTIDDNSLVVNVISSNAPLPTPIIFDENFPGKFPNNVHDLESVEGMYVELQDAIITAPTSEIGFLTITAADVRPFREPGIEWPGLPGLPVWDGNPEVFELDLLYQTVPILAAGSTVNATGIMSQGFFGQYEFLATEADFQSNNTTINARERNSDEITIGCINALFLNSDINRVQKMADYIVDKMKTPDIIAFQEVLGINVLENIADRVEASVPEIEYSAYLVSSGSISLGYLVRNTLTNVTANPLGVTEEVSTTGWTLHDRPPYLLEAKINTPIPTPISLINVHIRSLNGITGSDANFVRTKRHEQAISIANMVKDRQDENLFVLGDFNAFEFSDGYVDVINQIMGTPSEGALFPVVPVLEQPMVNLTKDFIAPDQQYSYIFRGNSQILDHCLAVQELDNLSVNEVIYIRNNADFYSEYLENFNTSLRVSDHDGFVIYLQLADTVSALEPEPPFTGDDLTFPNPLSQQDIIQVNLPKPGFVTVKLFGTDGRLTMHRNYGFYQNGLLQISADFDVASGVYFLEVTSTEFSETGKVLILNE